MDQVKKRAVVLNPQRMSLAEVLRQDWVVNAEEGTTVADVLDPGYWSHMARSIQVFDHIEVRLETGEWILELVALQSGPNWVRVQVMHKHELAESAEIGVPGAKHVVKWRGAHHKHCVVRVSDGEVLQAQLADAEAARTWMRNYEQVS